jgi:lipopolysaccharide export system permease protein
MMFFIGAPLGAIIRKGGLFAYYICSSNLYFFSLHQHFRKENSTGKWNVSFYGAWMSSFILSPLAILLTYRATNDIGLINMDVILSPFQKLFQKLFPSKK